MISLLGKYHCPPCFAEINMVDFVPLYCKLIWSVESWSHLVIASTESVGRADEWCSAWWGERRFSREVHRSFRQWPWVLESLPSSLALRSLVMFAEAIKGPVGGVLTGVRINPKTQLFVLAHRCCKGNYVNSGCSRPTLAQFWWSLLVKNFISSQFFNTLILGFILKKKTQLILVLWMKVGLLWYWETPRGQNESQYSCMGGWCQLTAVFRDPDLDAL